jgi:hypothetical protein
MWFNKVLPFNNPQESYAFTKLPLCTGKARSEQFYSLTIGEAIEGHELIDSRMNIRFKENISEMEFCKTKLKRGNKETIVNAIENNYWV